MFLYSGPAKETSHEIYQVYQRRIIGEFYSKQMCYNLMFLSDLLAYTQVMET